jgi:hypothetical protein
MVDKVLFINHLITSIDAVRRFLLSALLDVPPFLGFPHKLKQIALEITSIPYP